MRNFFLLILFFTMINKSCSQDSLDPRLITYRPPTVAGMFYPADPDSLKNAIKGYIVENNSVRITQDIVGIVVPHAGYVYSGWVAGKVYSELQGRQYDAVIIIGPSHRKAFKGSAVFNGEAYTTPLGISKIDFQLATEISKLNKDVSLSLNGHEWRNTQGEHSIEVQVPFLQVVLPDIPIVPICMGSQDEESIDALFRAIVYGVEKSGKKVLIVASTDLSHFYTQAKAKSIDNTFVNNFGFYDYFKMTYDLSSKKCEACGGGPTIVAMMVAERLGATQSYVSQYSNSAMSPEVKTSTESVVGYLSGLMFKGKSDSFDNLQHFNDDDKKRIMDAAKIGLENAVKGDSSDAVRYIPLNLARELATFVTLKKDGNLRGCMGHLLAEKPLLVEVEETAKLAGLKDPRFKPVTPDELSKISLEVTVLSRFKRVLETSEIQLGEDGVYLRVGYNTGLFLPQVATENNWDMTTYLEQLGRKAGLDINAYKDKKAELFKFKAIVID